MTEPTPNEPDPNQPAPQEPTPAPVDLGAEVQAAVEKALLNKAPAPKPDPENPTFTPEQMAWIERDRESHTARAMTKLSETKDADLNKRIEAGEFMTRAQAQSEQDQAFEKFELKQKATEKVTMSLAKRGILPGSAEYTTFFSKYAALKEVGALDSAALLTDEGIDFVTASAGLAKTKVEPIVPANPSDHGSGLGARPIGMDPDDKQAHDNVALDTELDAKGRAALRELGLPGG